MCYGSVCVSDADELHPLGLDDDVLLPVGVGRRPAAPYAGEDENGAELELEVAVVAGVELDFGDEGREDLQLEGHLVAAVPAPADAAVHRVEEQGRGVVPRVPSKVET